MHEDHRRFPRVVRLHEVEPKCPGSAIRAQQTAKTHSAQLASVAQQMRQGRGKIGRERARTDWVVQRNGDVLSRTAPKDSGHGTYDQLRWIPCFDSLALYIVTTADQRNAYSGSDMP